MLDELKPDTEILRSNRFPEREDPDGPGIRTFTLSLIERVDAALTPLLAELTGR